MTVSNCPKCQSEKYNKAGIVKGRQRYRCKDCGYHFSVDKIGKRIDSYYVVKALQLYVEGVSFREIERILGISHVSVMNWVRAYRIKRPVTQDYRPTYRVLTHSELIALFSDKKELTGAGVIITELGDKYMLIRWERFRD